MYNKLPPVPFDMKVLQINIPNKTLPQIQTSLELINVPDLLCNQWMNQTIDLVCNYNEDAKPNDVPLDDTDNMLISLYQKKLHNGHNM